jgi:hypothetical protein
MKNHRRGIAGGFGGLAKSRLVSETKLPSNDLANNRGDVTFYNYLSKSYFLTNQIFLAPLCPVCIMAAGQSTVEAPS